MIPRCFFHPAQRSGDLVQLPRPLNHYLVDVLRLKEGDALILLDNSGLEYPSVVETVACNELCCRIREERINQAEPRLNVILVQSLPKGEKFGEIIQKTTELGVRSIIPLLSEHSQIRWNSERFAGKLARWLAIATEAAEQCERGRVPEVRAPLTWTELWPQLPQQALILCFHARGGLPLAQVLATLKQETEHPVVLLIGPEGGWSDYELADMENRHIPLISLGRRVLRTETAAVAAVAMVLLYLENARL